MKAYITKYALTLGVQAMEVEEPNNGMVRAPVGYYFHWEGTEWHRTKDEALWRAEIMKSNKIESLKKQIEKLEKLRFE